MEPINIIIRKLTLEDLDQLQLISRSTFYKAFAAENTEEDMRLYMEDAFSTENLRSELNNPESTFHFVQTGNNVIGYIKLNTGNAQGDLQNENSLEISRIYIVEEYQGKNLGKKLLDNALEIAKQKKVDFAWLGVWEKNEGAIRFYERNGFVKFSSHPFMLGNDRQTDILMKFNIT
ncbi:MAG: GNAT family N-acetyltransferase [Ferruginibacter sp.]